MCKTMLMMYLKHMLMVYKTLKLISRIYLSNTIRKENFSDLQMDKVQSNIVPVKVFSSQSNYKLLINKFEKKNTVTLCVLKLSN